MTRRLPTGRRRVRDGEARFGLLRQGACRAAAPARPFRDELLSVERLEERARSLAARFMLDPSRRAARSVFPR